MIYMKQAVKHIREMPFAGLYTVFRNSGGVLRNFRGALRNFRGTPRNFSGAPLDFSGAPRNSRSGLSEPDLNRGYFPLYIAIKKTTAKDTKDAKVNNPILFFRVFSRLSRFYPS
jgi:hypothetical protein